MLRNVAQIISIVFHPLLMLTYMLLLLLVVNPFLFGVNKLSDATTLILIIFASTFIIPFFGIMMMKFLGLINSLQMRDKQERIGPFIMTGVFYLWMFKNFQETPSIPMAFTVFTLGSTIGLFVAFFINLFTKISLHALGAGGLSAMVAITMWLFSNSTFTLPFGNVELIISMNLLLVLTLLISGIICTSRLILDAHEPADLYGGYIVGVISMIIALKILI